MNADQQTLALQAIAAAKLPMVLSQDPLTYKEQLNRAEKQLIAHFTDRLDIPRNRELAGQPLEVVERAMQPLFVFMEAYSGVEGPDSASAASQCPAAHDLGMAARCAWELWKRTAVSRCVFY